MLRLKVDQWSVLITKLLFSSLPYVVLCHLTH
jgi:hypothetical protein